MRGQGGPQVARGEAGTGTGILDQATPPQVPAELPGDLSVKARLKALEQGAPESQGWNRLQASRTSRPLPVQPNGS